MLDYPQMDCHPGGPAQRDAKAQMDTKGMVESVACLLYTFIHISYRDTVPQVAHLEDPNSQSYKNGRISNFEMLVDVFKKKKKSTEFDVEGLHIRCLVCL